MFYRLAFVLLAALVCCIPVDAFAGPLGIFPNFHPGQRVAAVAKGVVKATANAPKLAVRRSRNRRGNCAGGTCRPA